MTGSDKIRRIIETFRHCRVTHVLPDRSLPASRHGYRNRLQCDILTFITGRGSHAGAGG